MATPAPFGGDSCADETPGNRQKVKAKRHKDSLLPSAFLSLA